MSFFSLDPGLGRGGKDKLLASKRQARKERAQKRREHEAATRIVAFLRLTAELGAARDAAAAELAHTLAELAESSMPPPQVLFRALGAFALAAGASGERVAPYAHILALKVVKSMTLPRPEVSLASYALDDTTRDLLFARLACLARWVVATLHSLDPKCSGVQAILTLARLCESAPLLADTSADLRAACGRLAAAFVAAPAFPALVGKSLAELTELHPAGLLASDELSLEAVLAAPVTSLYTPVSAVQLPLSIGLGVLAWSWAYPLSAADQEAGAVLLATHVLAVPALTARLPPALTNHISSLVAADGGAKLAVLGSPTCRDALHAALARAPASAGAQHLVANLAALLSAETLAGLSADGLGGYLTLTHGLVASVRADLFPTARTLKPLRPRTRGTSSNSDSDSDSDNGAGPSELAPMEVISGSESTLAALAPVDLLDAAVLHALLSPAHVQALIEAAGAAKTMSQLAVWIVAFVRLWPDDRIALLHTLCFSAPLIPQLWELITHATPAVPATLADYAAQVCGGAAVGDAFQPLFPLLLFLCELVHFALLSVDDEAFADERFAATLLSTRQTLELAGSLKLVLFHKLLNSSGKPSSDAEVAALEVGSKVLDDLVRRDSRIHFTSSDGGFWTADTLSRGAFAAQFVQEHASADEAEPWARLFRTSASTSTALDYVKRPVREVLSNPRVGATEALLSVMPYAVSFDDRVVVFRHLVHADAMSRIPQRHTFSVRRDHLVQDGYDGFARLGDGVRDALKIQFVDVNGELEAGVDGGGLFKEFMNHLVKAAFDPNYGLFCETPTSHRLYPNPHSSYFAANHLDLFSFLGAVVGKALYDGVLVELPLADFFVRKMLGFSNHVYDLASLDAELHASLMKLKYHEPASEVADWGITFELTDAVPQLELNTSIELVPNGASVAVDGSNRSKYVYLVAQYKLNSSIARQSAAFMAGMASVVPQTWLTMFAPHEVQMLLSGSEAGVDVADWAAHTQYSGGYTPSSPTVLAFWMVVADMTPEEQSDLLMFATSCSRPPLLGFGELRPKFCIHRAGTDTSRLPTAATCMHLLKLPDYGDVELLRAKLSYAVSTKAGFDLS
ncbi:E3 ubiquitin-protein ligase UPL6 [Thecamonas trahens ATCC 50062]|uniref:HECT-type E3 ubiquitin transferase n=1 Tax=Thecamonas trahens ATCC 50062 TaxID=461836 RepID=A0A0L0DDN4_THETB|nr:E3 ubiquitin-protein ligase UPL6 [Thecamonas trahens ATCC 50062]KNC50231.1 E3 ubiquitin-protein ligase UPL6 [Thecamonas trahens ATCC 50062]|eukprot:XP_013757062.1 E3 ubiquitin-protein ligase UPL6 [Thecamonas trahens ATCC 50062]